MDPVLLSTALKTLANKIDSEEFPSRSKIANQIQFIISGLFPESVPQKYDAEGNLIKVGPRPLPNAPEVQKSLQEMRKLREEREKAKYSPTFQEKRDKTNLDPATIDKLEKGNVVYYEIESVCPYCKWSTDEEVSSCPECTARLEHGKDPIFNTEYNPIKHAVKVKKLLKIFDLKSFIEYLEDEKRNTYTKKELDIITTTTNIPEDRLKRTLSDAGYSLEGISSKDPDFEYSSLDRFVQHLKDDGKDFCTEQQFRKLLSALQFKGLPGLDKVTGDIVSSSPNPSQQKLFLEMYLAENNIAIGDKSPILKPKSEKTEKKSPKREKIDARYVELAKTLKDIHGNNIKPEEVEQFIIKENLTNVPGTEPVMEAWLNAQYEEVAKKLGITKRDILKMIAQDLIPEEFESGGLFNAVEEALTRPSSDE